MTRKSETHFCDKVMLKLLIWRMLLSIRRFRLIGKCDRASGDHVRSAYSSHRHASEGWHPALLATHIDRKLDPNLSWGDGMDGV
jgi:hypothetical protein